MIANVIKNCPHIKDSVKISLEEFSKIKCKPQKQHKIKIC